MFCRSVGVKNHNSKVEQSAHPTKRQLLVLNVLISLYIICIYVCMCFLLLCVYYFFHFLSNSNKQLSDNVTSNTDTYETV